MTTRRVASLLSFVVIAALLMLIPGCTTPGLNSPDADTYAVSGQVLNNDGTPMAGVSIAVTNSGAGAKSRAIVVSGADGAWSATAVSGESVIVPIKEGVAFKPSFTKVTRATEGVRFWSIASDSVVNLHVSWADIGTVVASKGLNTRGLGADVTDVGVRLEYPVEDAAFTQSVPKTVAATAGLITMKVPPTAKANLFVVAATRQNEWSGVARLLGVKRDIVIPTDGRLDISVDDLTWIEPSWKVADCPLKGKVNAALTDPIGTINLADEDLQSGTWGDGSRYFQVDLHVRDPFQLDVTGNTPFGDLLMSFNGISGTESNTDGWDLVHAWGIEHDGSISLMPCVSASKFQLKYQVLRIPPLYSSVPATFPPVE